MVNLCSTGLARTNRYADEFANFNPKETFSSIVGGSVVPIADGYRNSDDSNEEEVWDNDGDRNDLTPLYSVLNDENRDLLKGEGHANAKCLLRLAGSLKMYLLDIPKKELPISEQEAFILSEGEVLIFHEEEEENLFNEENSDQRNNNPRWGELFPIAQEFKEKFSSEQLRSMDIDFERFLKINLLHSMGLKRPFTSKEESRLDKATFAFDPSPEQRIWDVIDAIKKRSSTPEEAFEIVKSVVEEGNVDIISPYRPISYANRSSFLSLASSVKENKGLEIVRFLLDHGADADMCDDLATPLYNAVIFGNTEVIELLIDRGVDVNLQSTSPDREGWTPLHEAVYYGDFEIARLLLDHGADPSIRDDKGKTPSDIAMEEKEKTNFETTRRKYDEILDKLRSHTI